MKKSNLDSLSEDLCIAKSEIQKEKIGGSWDMSLPSIVVGGGGWRWRWFR